VWISEQTAIISLYNINWLVCITETECVYCTVRTESLYIIQVNLSLQRGKQEHSKQHTVSTVWNSVSFSSVCVCVCMLNIINKGTWPRGVTARRTVIFTFHFFYVHFWKDCFFWGGVLKLRKNDEIYIKGSVFNQLNLKTKRWKVTR
jgi:hypothetical protein